MGGPAARRMGTAVTRRAAAGDRLWRRRDTNPADVEQMVTLAQHAAVAAWLHAGLDVVVDDTCQAQSTMDAWVELAVATGADLHVWDFRDVPLEVCIARDAQRGQAGGRLVGESAIRRVAERCAAVKVPKGTQVHPGPQAPPPEVPPVDPCQHRGPEETDVPDLST
ncbi:hypothetical protein GCM10007977_109930 [Dactylosporangium sucinum]|uniref:Uncharacterized protein n=1 Tax=Dactylosporangium sucinum TaxID=1424081 RepID=A0A917UHR0_9ACTN|nr:hypothetical protein GCM10007977_109930 [Dactylosporangium sucinum]